MKRVLRNLVVLVGVVVGCGFYSCVKQETSAAVIPGPTGSITANFGGQNLTLTATDTIINSKLYISGGTFGSGSPFVSFTAIQYTENFMGSYVLNNISYADYTEGFQTHVWHLYYPTFEYVTDSTHTGVLNITSYNTTNQTITGTFSFEGYQNPKYTNLNSAIINITNGTFWVKLP